MIVPILAEARVLAVKVTVIVLLPLPLKGVTVNHVASTVIVQLVLELILKAISPAPDPTAWLIGVTASKSIPLWVTVTG